VLAYGITGESGEEGEAQWILARLGVSFFFAMNVVLLSVANYAYPFSSSVATILDYVKMLLSTPVILLLGIPILRNSLDSVSRYRLNIDTLIVIGTFSAYAVSAMATFRSEQHVYFDTAVMILVLVTLGRYLEANARASSTGALKRFMDLIPTQAVVIRDDNEVKILPDSVKPGDMVKIIPGSNFPVDGEIVDGEGAINESILTGESRPVCKSAGDSVFSGTTSIDGLFYINAISVGENTTVSRLAKLVEESRSSRPFIQRFSDRVSEIFIPVVIFIALLTFAFWYFETGLNKALLSSLSVLLISCPCALGIATPMAVWISIGKAAEKGILVRTGETLEKLSGLKTVFFDKTGTLTGGNPVLSGIYLGGNCSIGEKDFIQLASSAERGSEHPFAKSLVSYAEKNNFVSKRTESFRYIPGSGISSDVDGRKVFVGSRRLMEREGIVEDNDCIEKSRMFESEGNSVIRVAWDGEVRGLIAFSEEERDGAREMLDDLAELGINTTVITGDGKFPSRMLGKKLGVEVISELTPEQKVDVIRGNINKKSTTAMVGDGVNDAPALNAADVGIAVACGADITRESADISLIGDDLKKIPWIIRFSILTVRKIKQNLLWAFIYNIIGIGLAIAGVLQPVFAAFAMIVSSMFVLGNSLSLKKGKPN